MEKKFDLLTLTFGQLSYNPKINARGDTKTDITALAETIKNEGLIQPLAVRPAGKKYEPAEGGRRYHAIALLIEKKAPGWTTKTPIPAISRKLTDAEALEASLATHLTRLGLEPGDQALAFRNLAKSGRKPADIAATFAVTDRFVEQRLAIGALPPAILKALKDKTIDLKTAEAFTLTGDAKEQLALFNSLAKRKDLNPLSVRQQLTGKATRANDAHARYVGEAVYVKAGGTITADLFGEDRFFQDGKLLNRLFDEKVKAKVKALEAEGWSFVKVARDHWQDYDGYNSPWTRLTSKSELPGETKKRIGEIDAQLGQLKRFHYNWGDPRRDAHHLEILSLQDERASLATSSFTKEQKAKSGVVIRIQPGRFEIMYGMVDPEVRRAAEKEKKAAEKKREKESAKKAAQSGKTPAADSKAVVASREADEPDFAGQLKAELARHMSGALRLAIAGKPQGAHYALIATLLLEALPDDGAGEFGIYEDSPIAIRRAADARDWRNAHLDDEKETSEFDKLLAEAMKPFIPVPPEDKAERKRWSKNGGDMLRLADVIAKLELMPFEELQRLEALLVARALKITFNFMSDSGVTTLIKRFDPDVAKVWKPDDAFFQKLKKPDLVAALDEAAIADIPRSGSKAQLVALAVANLPAMQWLPKPMRPPSYAGPGSNAWADARGARVADAVAGQALAPAAPMQQAAE